MSKLKKEIDFIKLGLIVFKNINKINIDKKIKQFLYFNNKAFTIVNLTGFNLK